MQIEMPRKVLQEALARVKAAVTAGPAANALPIMASVLLIGDGKSVAVIATTGAVWAKTIIPLATEQFELLLPHKRTSSILAEMTGDDVILKIGDHQLTLKSAGAEFDLPTEVPSAYPWQRRELPAGVEFIESDQFVAMLRRVDYARRSSVGDRFGATADGIRVRSLNDNLQVEATDARRFAWVETPRVGAFDEFIAPSVVLPLISAMFEAEMLHLVKPSENERVFYGDSGSEIGFLLIQGSWPKMDIVVNMVKECKLEVQVQPDLLLKAVRQVALLTHDESRGVTMTKKVTKLDLHYKSLNGTADSSVEVLSSEGAIPSLIFDPKFMADYLNQAGPEPVTIRIADSTRPFVLEQGGYRNIITPMVR